MLFSVVGWSSRREVRSSRRPDGRHPTGGAGAVVGAAAGAAAAAAAATKAARVIII